MRVIAARFREWSRAQAALAALRARFGLRGDQAEAAVLASEGTGRPAVVAGQFHEDRMSASRQAGLLIDDGASHDLGAEQQHDAREVQEHEERDRG